MGQQPRLPLWFLLANWALIAAAFFAGHWFGNRRHPDLPEPQRTAFELVHREILASHVDAQDAARLLDRAITGMVTPLDPYSRYVAPDEVARYDEANSGRYEGIGAHMRRRGDEVILWFPRQDSPAERAGLLPGDRLLAVDGKALDTEDLRQRAAELVRGPADTDVTLRIRREVAPNERDVVVRRATVQRPCVRWRHFVDREQGLGYLHLSDFHPGARQQLVDGIAAMQQEGTLRGLVLDLRFDGGGSLPECIAIAKLFLRSGRIVSQQRRGEAVEVHDADGTESPFAELPLVLLVNERSASASEVLAAALQDHGRAAIVGQRTHGKGAVNTVYAWKDLPFRLKLTTGRYLRPSGRDIERHQQRADGTAADPEHGGVHPDVAVAVDRAETEANEQALAADEVPPQYLAAATAVAQQLGIAVPTPPDAVRDRQLAAALTSLRERVSRGSGTPTNGNAPASAAGEVGGGK
jgi:carboxyl-terminal processing protease